MNRYGNLTIGSRKFDIGKKPTQVFSIQKYKKKANRTQQLDKLSIQTLKRLALEGKDKAYIIEIIKRKGLESRTQLTAAKEALKELNCKEAKEAIEWLEKQPIKLVNLNANVYSFDEAKKANKEVVKGATKNKPKSKRR